MKLKAIIIIVPLLLFSSYKAISQPGYRGKKNIVKYCNLLSPGWSFASYGRPAGVLNFNMSHELSLSRTFSRRTMITFKTAIYRTSIPYELLINDVVVYNSEGVSQIKANVYSAGLEYYLFKRKLSNLAPLGNYLMLDCNVLWINVLDTKHNQDLGGLRYGNMGFWIGKQKIFNDKIVFDIAVGSRITTPFWLTKMGDALDTEDYIHNLKTSTLNRISARNFFNLKLGVGYLF